MGNSESTALKPPTPQGISRLLAQAGFERSNIPSKRRGLAYAGGFQVEEGRLCGDGIIVYWWAPPGTPPTEVRASTKAMLAKFAEQISGAGWHVDVERVRLIVTASFT